MLRKIELLGAEVVCDFLMDSYRFDTFPNLVTGTGSFGLLLTKVGKTLDQYNFHSEGAWVQKDRIFEILAIVARIYGTPTPDEFDMKSIFEYAYFDMLVDEDREDIDNLLRWAGGIDIPVFVEPGNLGFLDRAYVGNGTHGNVRIYAKHKMAPGAKTTQITISYPRAGGSANLLAREFQVGAYGYELKARAKVGQAK